MDKQPTQPTAGQLPIPKAGRGGLKGYFKEVSRELKKVDWPAPSETNRLTGVVLAVCGLVVAVLYGLSFVAAELISFITTGKMGA